LVGNIKGKTVDHIVANSEESTSSGFDIVFTDGTVLEIYGVKICWCMSITFENVT